MFNIHACFLLIKKIKNHCSMVWGPVDLYFGSQGCCLGAPYFCKRFAGWLEENLSDKGGEEDLVGCSSLPFLGYMEGKKRVVLENEAFSVHKLQSSFVFSLQSLAKLCVNSESPFVCNLVSLVRV